jgi:hypothetical protein
VIDTSGDRVVQLAYIADPGDVQLCPRYFDEPELFIQTMLVHPPAYVSINCPATAVAGTNVIVKGNTSVGAKRGLSWKVTAGKIISGQYTHRISLDTTGLAGRTVRVDGEMDDGFGHVATTSCIIEVLPN